MELKLVFRDVMQLRDVFYFFFFFSSRRRHTRSLCDWSSDVCFRSGVAAQEHRPVGLRLCREPHDCGNDSPLRAQRGDTLHLLNPVLQDTHHGLRTAQRRQPMRNRSSLSRRSEEHTSELQSHSDLVCRLLLEKKITAASSSLPQCSLARCYAT